MKNQSISFWPDEAKGWHGFVLAHLFALHYYGAPVAGSNAGVITFFFSTDIIVVEGRNLRPLFNFLVAGGELEEKLSYQIDTIRSFKYENHLRTDKKAKESLT